MMKWIKRILVFAGVLIIGLFLFLFFYLQSTKPVYSGSIALDHLNSPVETYFDDFGIPHIYGGNEHDVFLALGYLHAQEKLFQMEMLRRVSSGRLSVIFGSNLVDVDRFFRMLGINQLAENSARSFEEHATETWVIAAKAYLDGINQYIEKGKTPVEFQLLEIPKEKFTARDLFLIGDYMSFNFQMGFRTDPLLSRIRKKTSDHYLQDIAMGYVPGSVQNQVDTGNSVHAISENTSTFNTIESKLPFKCWMGSNAWVLGPSKTKSGKVLFENDTHIGFQQPAIWYEADLECPGFRFYGNYFSGFPFAPIGHTPHHAWGLTIFENDDLDFFVEKSDAQHPDQVWYKDHWEKLSIREEIIQVKDSADLKIRCRSSTHGPVCSDVMDDFKEITSNPVSVCWTLLKEPSNLIEETYRLAHAKSMNEFRAVVSTISAPGLNVLYGDIDNNIAWWTAAKLVHRPEHVSPALLLDGSTGADDWLGFYDFSYNPKSENPSCGYVYSANNQPGKMKDVLYPGYYLSEDRALRITQVLGQTKLFTLADMETLNTDVTNPAAARVCKQLLARLNSGTKLKSSLSKKVCEILEQWNGKHSLADAAPSIYYHWLYLVLHNAMADEMGEKDFEAFLKTHAEKNTVAPFVSNDSSAWWDNRSTEKIKESNTDIISASFEQAINDLRIALGENPDQWFWFRVHTTEFEHPIGKKKPFDRFFNVGPFPEMGGIETVNNASFNLTPEIGYKSNLGPALRRTLDFADPESGHSIIPTGQSGNFMSAHYDDQAKLYIEGKVRKEIMNEQEVKSTCKNKLVFLQNK